MSLVEDSVLYRCQLMHYCNAQPIKTPRFSVLFLVEPNKLILRSTQTSKRSRRVKVFIKGEILEEGRIYTPGYQDSLVTRTIPMILGPFHMKIITYTSQCTKNQLQKDTHQIQETKQ